LKVAFYGDSIVRGMRGTSSGSVRWTTLVSEWVGWTELNFGADGLGFVARPTVSARRAGVRAEVLEEVVECDALACVVALGLNDSVLVGGRPEDVRRAMDDDFARLVDRFGRDGVLVMDLYSPFGRQFPPGWTRVRQLLRDEARASGLRFLPGMATAIGGRAELLHEDGLHPNDAGHRSLALAVWSSLERALA
jgi:lysophospholipase L1-like esterase